MNWLRTLLCISSRFFSNSEASASELLKDHEEMFPRYRRHISDPLPNGCMYIIVNSTHRERVKYIKINVK